MNRRHALESPGLFGNIALKCGREGEVITLHPKRFAVRSPKGMLYYLANAGEAVTCRRCAEDYSISDATRLKMSLAKRGNQNARKIKPASPHRQWPHYGD